jgi:type II secretory pathway predicted ATPase ExeA
VNELDPSSFRICHIELSNPNKRAVYKTLAVKMGLSPAFNTDDIKLQLINFFSEENEQGKFNCVIIDESHSLSIPMIDELRSFYDEGANFSLILAGLPQLLSRTMNLSVNMPMKQRINLIVEMNPLTLAKTKEYVKHQMDLAKVKNEVFDEKCYPVIHSFTSGTPRRINQLCYQVLVNSYFESKVIVTASDIEDLVKNMPHMFLGNNQNN